MDREGTAPTRSAAHGLDLEALLRPFGEGAADARVGRPGRAGHGAAALEARFPLLARLETPAELRSLPESALPQLAGELTGFLVETVARCGGHFSAGLGTVELTIALHYVLETPRDTLVWDVGHQCYPHKVLTGRRDRLATIRSQGGLSAFLHREESVHDAFGAGHSSTSISAALGMSIANRLHGDPARCVAIIGDGALTAGMAYEALQHAGATGADLLVVLNDNGMSISPNVGALSDYLKALAGAAGRDGAGPAGTLFEDLGFEYRGPVDGHDLPALVGQLRAATRRRGPQLLHVLTRKGHGYPRAEADPVRYHGVTPFDPSLGIVPPGAAPAPTYTQVFGDWLLETVPADPSLVVVTPAMIEGSGLAKLAARHPDRCIDVGIAEQHAVTLAAGLACRGVRPIVAIYSTFLQRAYDQLVHDVALQGLPVTFAIDRAGVVGPDGATHNGSLDLSFLRCVPGMVVMAPSDGAELRLMLEASRRIEAPVAIRYPRSAARPGQPGAPPLRVGRAWLRRRGRGTAILAFGTLVEEALAVAAAIDASVYDMRFVKPLDETTVLAAAASHTLVVTLEENAVAGGAGAAVDELLAVRGLSVPVLNLGLPDRPLAQGTRAQVLAEAGLDVASIRRAIEARAAQRG
ncbi:MAG: 1-deoxy-D-xylulose-5-phosphate synthase [Steroidobacteraceae bacterium]|jgi:1-deoxy-D-xylulose-5-phosphate synthase|nr:1-deoxy-D-xylulose-5-phosphate synthase [Steroidobacteraceae bacterium]